MYNIFSLTKTEASTIMTSKKKTRDSTKTGQKFHLAYSCPAVLPKLQDPTLSAETFTTWKDSWADAHLCQCLNGHAVCSY